MDITRQKDSTFKVKSKEEDSFYIVDFVKGTCTCPNYRFRMAKIHGLCKHLEAVKDMLEKRDEDNYVAIISFVKEQKEVDSLVLIKKFSEQAVDDLLSRGE